jgi:hypothetical protein
VESVDRVVLSHTRDFSWQRGLSEHASSRTWKRSSRVVTKISTPLVRRQKGLVACYARKPTGSTPDEFAMVSVWTDIAPLKAFTVGRWH